MKILPFILKLVNLHTKSDSNSSELQSENDSISGVRNRCFSQNSSSQPKPLLLRAWQQVKSFFSSTKTNISELFGKVVGNHSSDKASHSFCSSSSHSFCSSSNVSSSSSQNINAQLFNSKINFIEKNLNLILDQLVGLDLNNNEKIVEFLYLVNQLESNKNLLGSVNQSDFIDKFEVISNLFALLEETVQSNVINQQNQLTAFFKQPSNIEIDELQSYCGKLLRSYGVKEVEEEVFYDADEEVFYDADEEVFYEAEEEVFYEAYKENTSEIPQEVKATSPESERISGSKPKGITNIGNACYRIASNQALLACKPLMDLIRRPLIEEEVSQAEGKNANHFKKRQEAEIEFKSREAVRVALVDLLDSLESGKSPSEIEYAEEKLCVTLFSSKLHAEFISGDEFRQLDATSYLELILAAVLNYQHMEQPTYSAKNVAGELCSSKSSADPVPLIYVPLLRNVTSLQDLVDRMYSETQEGDSDNTWRYNDSNVFKSYRKHVQITSKPKDVLILQLRRGVRNIQAGTYARGAAIDKRKIQIPDGGILDFSHAHGLPDGTLKYGVKSFIRLHAESGAGGHYTSYVNKDGQWYHCDDNSVKRVSDEEAQKEMSLAYIFFFEKSS